MSSSAKHVCFLFVAWTFIVQLTAPYVHHSSFFLLGRATQPQAPSTFFQFPSIQHHRLAQFSLSVVENNKEDEQLTEDFPDYLIAGDKKKEGDITVVDDSLLSKDLQARRDQLKNGIGRRYKARTQRGFLNVHNDTSSPFSTRNIIGQLAEGQVVTSIGPNEGDWVNHDAFGGGWSISNFGGWQWLIPLED